MTTIKFRYSRVFEEYNKQNWLAQHDGVYPSPDEILFLLKARQRLWKKHEKKVVRTLEKIVGVTFSEDTITCYVVGRGVPISDPVIMPIFANRPATRFVDSLAHELTHRLLSQKDGTLKMRRVTKMLRKKYPHEPWNVILHVMVDAVMAELYKKVFTAARIKSDYRFISSIQEYKRAWEIVFEITPKGVLQPLRK
ncbi:MAG: hypothetical protein Q8P33_02260 [bacterium]|nr:hypothetical protein [bacterium]